MISKYFLLVASFVAACFAQVANAQVPALYGSTSAFQWMQMAASGNTVSLGAGQISSINSGNFAISSGAGADLQTITRAKLPIGNANLAVDVVAKIPAASVAKAVANFAVKVVVPLQIGVAVYDLVKELGFFPKQDGTGTTFYKEVPAPLLSAYEYSMGFGWYRSAVAAGQSAIGPAWSSFPNTTCTVSVWTPDPTDQFMRTCTNNKDGGSGSTNYRPERRGAACPANTTWSYDGCVPAVPAPPMQQTISRQALEDAIASKSGWPSSSAIARAVKDAINSGESVDVVPQTVTGPASTPDTTTSSTTSGSPAVAPTSGTSTSPGTAGSPAVDSITTTSTSTNNYTYQGNKVTVTNTTVTNITNNTTGQQQTTKTDKAPEIKNSDLKPDKVEDPATDTALGDVPKLYTPVYPRGIEGVWSDAKSAMAGTSLARIIPSLMPSVGSSGQCPTMPINLNLSRWANFGTVDVAPPCFLWDFGKVVIIMSALLLARGLVFGG